MKQFVKKALLPLAVFVVAVVSAFAMNTPSTSAAPEQFQPLYTGAFCYIHPSTGACTNLPGIMPVAMNCTLVETPTTCTINIDGVGNNILLRTCTPDLAHPGQWICVAPLYKRTVLRAS
ncbi:DUF6520 family protein [Myroides guanonis]|uniref:Secreted protein n=1 Tax=Myroides guanonis TaxID=1150112 RepID=A0A1I3SSP1_9FLAO|nr:DUF6520 family protein [Myroides guanonis]SFJ60601.1 hypothetical protein SAMN04487893_11135 [Myroides guanonis]